MGAYRVVGSMQSFSVPYWHHLLRSINTHLIVDTLRGYKFGYIAGLIYGRGAGVPRSRSSIFWSSALVRLWLELFLYMSTFHSFRFLAYTLGLILVSVSSSCLTLAVFMFKVSCVGYAPREWDHSSQQLPCISRRNGSTDKPLSSSAKHDQFFLIVDRVL